MKRIRLNFPQRQGGMNPDYLLGSQLISLVVPPSKSDEIFDIKVNENFSNNTDNRFGIDRYDELLEQKKQVVEILDSEKPDEIITIGGDCSVSEAPLNI